MHPGMHPSHLVEWSFGLRGEVPEPVAGTPPLQVAALNEVKENKRKWLKNEKEEEMR